jgi:hypothetical protein
VLLADGRVLVGGGGDASAPPAQSEIFDPVQEVWTDAGNMNIGRLQAIGVPLDDGTVLVAGGISGEQCIYEECETLYTSTAELFTP